MFWTYGNIWSKTCVNVFNKLLRLSNPEWISILDTIISTFCLSGAEDKFTDSVGKTQKKRKSAFGCSLQHVSCSQLLSQMKLEVSRRKEAAIRSVKTTRREKETRWSAAAAAGFTSDLCKIILQRGRTVGKATFSTVFWPEDPSQDCGGSVPSCVAWSSWSDFCAAFLWQVRFSPLQGEKRKFWNVFQELHVFPSFQTITDWNLGFR